MSTGDTPQRTRVDPADLVGRTIADRYALARLVTAGANTWVYDATDHDTGRGVTVKLLRPSIAAPPSFRERFDDEMRGVAALSHPNIVALFDWGVSPVGDVSTAFVVTEALAGGSLRDMFDRGRRLTPSQALMVGLDACRGLDHAHRRGFVHTELTPSKLVFGDDRRLRIADFGLAHLLGAASWEQPESVPNHVAWYAAPEQGAGSPLDGRADVYALCLSLLEAVTGEVPFRTDSTIATLAARVGRLMPVSADLGPLAAVLEHAGRPEASERATAAQFGQELVQAASKLPRPEPLPLMASGLFDTPADQLRGPDDPTGGVTRPATGAAAPIVVVPATPDDSADESAGASAGEPASEPTGEDGIRTDVLQGVPIVTAAEVGESDLVGDDADAVVETDGVDASERLTDVTTGDELVILPVDSELDGGPEATLPEPVPIPPPVETSPAADPDALPETAAMPVTAVPPQIHHPPRRRRAGVYWKIALGVLLLAALAVLGVLASQLLRTPEYLVPDLVGTPEAEARNLVAANDWDVVVERERSDLVPVVGQVIRTVPSAGVSLAEGEPFLIVVSEGPVLRELPDSTGSLLVDAETRLRDRGLVPRITEVFDEVVPLGTVVSWSVPGDPTLGAGSLVPPETEVELVVSQGPVPRQVPDLINVAGTEARTSVEGLGLVYAQERAEFSDDVEVGRVISQVPDAGTEIARGGTVSVVVSLGPDVVPFPDLSGAASYEQAAAILVEAGFEPRLTFGDAQGQLLSVTIAGEDAVVGAPYRRGKTVEIEAISPEGRRHGSTPFFRLDARLLRCGRVAHGSDGQVDEVDLKDRVAVVTGAGRGLGREHALFLAAQGTRVVVNDRGVSNEGTGSNCSTAEAVVAQILEAGGEAVANCDDVASWDGAQAVVQSAIDEFGDLDILVNNAGILRDSTIVNMSEDDFDEVVRVHLKGHVAMTKWAANHWRGQSKLGVKRRRNVIHTGSTSGIYANPGQSNYGPAKSAIVTFSQIAATELSRYDVVSNCVLPGARTRLTLASPGLPEIMQAPADGFDQWDPANVSPIIAYLASADCPFNGETFYVQGGTVRRLEPWSITGPSIERPVRWELDELDEAMAEFVRHR